MDSEPTFFEPKAWRKKAENKKQGSADETLNGWWFGDEWFDVPYAVSKHHDACLDLYLELIGGGICPEQARMVLPQSMYTSYYVSGSLAAWARFYNLRVDPHAQVEIQDLARDVGKLIEPLFPVSWAALTGWKP